MPILIFQLPKDRLTKSMPSRRQQTSVQSSSLNTQGQRSCAPNHDYPASNYRFSFGSFGTKVISVCGWRFAPACCAAKSVIRRGPSCAMPFYRLAWAANLAAPQQGSPIKRFVSENGSMHRTSFSRRQENQAARPNHSLNRTYCGRPAFGLQKPSPNTSPPQ